MNCERCNKNHDGTYGSGRFCSIKCAKGYSTSKSRKDINKRVSECLKIIKPAQSITKTCLYCNAIFTIDWSHRRKKFCNRSCSGKFIANLPGRRKLYSDRMIKRIEDSKHWMSGGGRKVEFQFGDQTIKCDSVLEWSGLSWITRTHNVISIKRNAARIPYVDPDSNVERTFIPDFIVTTNNIVIIIECKSKQNPKRDGATIWKNYQRLVPVKQAALITYCKEQNFNLIWFDEDTDKKEYYAACKQFHNKAKTNVPIDQLDRSSVYETEA